MAAKTRRSQTPKPRNHQRNERMRTGAEPRGERYTRSIKHRNRMFQEA